MNTSGIGKKRCAPAFGEPPTEKVETLPHEHLKKLLAKQLKRRTTVAEELEREQNLCEPIIVKDETSASKGVKSLCEFQEIMEKEKLVVSLREHGLTEAEIKIKLSYQEEKELSCNSHSKERLKTIDEKIEKHKEFLLKPSQYTQTVDVSRRELETDCASQFSHGSSNFSYLINLKTNEYSSNDPVLATLMEYEDSERKKATDDGDSSESENERFIGPLLCSVNDRVEIMPEETIVRNRLSLSNIHSLERFKDYKAGDPSRILYIKNLAKNVTEKDLAQLFARYYNKESSNVEYKVMNGRMRGQAFVTFKDEKTATEALLFNNGYVLNGKPIIISYSKKKGEGT